MAYRKEYDYVSAIVYDCVPVSLSPREIEEAFYDDKELTLVKKCVRTGNWAQCTLPSYAQVKDKLRVYSELLLHGTRIVIPRLLHDRVVQLGHKGPSKSLSWLLCHLWISPPETMSRVFPPIAPWLDC